MADFTDGFWNMYVAGFVVFGLLLCAVLLVFNMTARQSGEPKVQGHVWDETLKEYNNPLPSWWLFLFWGTIIFAVVYLVIYPGFGNRLSYGKEDKGLRSEYAADVKATENLFSQYANTDLNSLASNSKLMETTGRRLFLTYCSQCHASTGKGAGKGFPNLTDGDW
ncbi:MAG: cytochrome C oxidase Cbb3, partial [Azoarcus sp.]|nr:cytochrome C oxidase Cbb3 [Azoarcus sp.]